MASGDTKTEALLNILGNGGTGDEYRGSGNTKTQNYILDAIDRINALGPSGGSFNIYDVYALGMTDPNNQVPITTAQYEAIESACLKGQKIIIQETAQEEGLDIYRIIGTASAIDAATVSGTGAHVGITIDIATSSTFGCITLDWGDGSPTVTVDGDL